MDLICSLFGWKRHVTTSFTLYNEITTYYRIWYHIAKHINQHLLAFFQLYITQWKYCIHWTALMASKKRLLMKACSSRIIKHIQGPLLLAIIMQMTITLQENMQTCMLCMHTHIHKQIYSTKNALSNGRCCKGAVTYAAVLFVLRCAAGSDVWLCNHVHLGTKPHSSSQRKRNWIIRCLQIHVTVAAECRTESETIRCAKATFVCNKWEKKKSWINIYWKLKTHSWLNIILLYCFVVLLLYCIVLFQSAVIKLDIILPSVRFFTLLTISKFFT